MNVNVNSFTWEDLPHTDADTGNLTKGGRIPRINVFGMRAAITIVLFHFGLSAYRIMLNHETIFTAWYAIDWNDSPFYELLNVSQVTVFINKVYKILNRSQLYYS